MTQFGIVRSKWYRVLKKVCWSNKFVRKVTVGWDDKKYIKVNYKWCTGRKLNLDYPTLYTEKLQWLSLNDHSDIRTIASDKYAVRDYVSQRMKENHLPDILIPLIAVYDRVDDIDWEKLPKSFVMKANHGSGWNVLVDDKDLCNKAEIMEKLNRWLNSSYYIHSREHQYKNIQPRIVCEKFLRNDDGSEILDYKFMCFNGIPQMLWIDHNRHTNHVRNFYDLDGNPLSYESDEPADYSIKFIKPDNYELMLEIVKVLAKPFKHVRVDLYNLNGKVYFGELTFSSWGGFVVYRTPELDKIWGDMLQLN